MEEKKKKKKSFFGIPSLLRMIGDKKAQMPKEHLGMNGKGNSDRKG